MTRARGRYPRHRVPPRVAPRTDGKCDVQRRQAVLLSFAAASVILALLTVFALELANTQAKSRDDVGARVHERAVLAAALIDSLFEAVGQQAPADARKYGAPVVSDDCMEANRRTSRTSCCSTRPSACSRSPKASRRRPAPAWRTPPRWRSCAPAQPYGLGNVLPYGKDGVVNLAVALDTPVGQAHPRDRLRSRPRSARSSAASCARSPASRARATTSLDGRRARPRLDRSRRARPATVFGDPAEVEVLARPAARRTASYFDQARITRSTWRVVLPPPRAAVRERLGPAQVGAVD